MKRRSFVVLAASTFLAATSFSSPLFAEAKTPVQGGVLNVGYISDVKTLNPILSAQWTERQILFLIFDTLVEINPDFTLRPGLAKSWEFENDGERIVMTLQEGVSFHDGTPFDAAAVKWNLETRIDPEEQSSQRGQLDLLESVEVIDEHTVAINLKEAYPPFVSLLADRAGLMVSPASAEKFGEDLGSHPVGTGPFVFKSWNRGTSLQVERNPSFWRDGQPYLDAVTFHDIPSNIVGVQRLGIGELDFVTQLGPLDVKLAAAMGDVQVVQSALANWHSLQVKWDSEPYSNPKLRQAIAHAVNRDRLNEIMWESKGTVSDGFTPDNMWWHNPDLKSFAYDPAKAAELYKEAGLPADTMLSLAAPSGEVLRRLTELVHEDLRAAGIPVELAPVPQSEYYAKTVSGEIRFTPMRWTPRADPDGLIQYLFHKDGTANSTGYDNPEVNAWIEEARKSQDQAQRTELYHKVQAQIAEDIPYISLGFSAEFSVLGQSVEGYVPMPDVIPRYRDMWKALK